MSRRFTRHFTAAVSALAVGGWLAAGTVAAQEGKPEAKKASPAAAAPKAEAPTKSAAPHTPQAPRQGAAQPRSAPQAQPQPAQAQKPAAPPRVEQPTDRAAQATDAARDRAVNQAEQARDRANDATRNARNAARDAKQDSQDAARDARDNAREARDGAQDRVNDARNKANDARDNATGPRPNDADRDQNADRTDKRDADRNNEGATRHQTNRAYSSDNDRRGDRDHRGGDRHNAAFHKIGVNVNVTNQGLAIASIVPNSVFATAGFRTGDVIVSVGNRRFDNSVVFYDWLRTVQPGQRVAIIVLRDGQQQTVYWTPTEQWVQEFSTFVDEGAPGEGNFLGIHLDPQIQDAAIVADVDANSPAARAGIRRNDAIESVNGQQVGNADDFTSLTSQLPPGEAVQMSISRLMNVQVLPGGGVAPQTAVESQQTYVNPPANPTPVAAPSTAPNPAAQAVTPAPRQTAAPGSQPRTEDRRGGLFRRR